MGKECVDVASRSDPRLRVLSALVLVAAGLCGCKSESAPSPWLVDATQEFGVHFRYEPGEAGRKQLPAIMGGGVAIFDADGDGRLDLYFANGHDGPLGEAGDGTLTNRFFAQQPDGTFVDRTAQSGLGDHRYGMGVAIGDVNNDGMQDVLVTNFGDDQLFLNNGDGTFTNVTEEWHLAAPGFSASATFCDLDRDGWLDLFITRYVEFDPEQTCYDPAGRVDYCGPQSYPGKHDLLLMNEGGSGFRDVSAASGITGRSDHGLGVVCEDFDGDGRPDLLVANDGDANHLWLNQGDGRFVDDAVAMGMAYDQHGMAEAGMGVVAEDFDGDGRVEAFMTHLENETNTLYRPIGPAAYQDATGRSGMGMASMPFTGFGVAAIDLELDGDLDLLVANGRVRSYGNAHPDSASPAPWATMGQPDQVFVNRGGNFELLPQERCPACRTGFVSRGLAVGDLDGDGDLDAVVVHVDAPATFWRNDAPREGRWLKLRAFDPVIRRDAIGAVVTLNHDGVRQRRVVRSGSGYLSAMPTGVHFGLPESAGEVAIEVVWPNGGHESFSLDCLDCERVLVRGEGVR